MFNLSYTQEYKGKVKTLKLKRNPFRYGLGHYEDVDGNKWDVAAIMNGCVNARRICGQSYYGTATGDNQDGHHTWKPYFVEVV